ncbi:hypothetical protein QQF64_020118 [Cirrhinus molitorella]|uniref:L1 transposable element RRM domain-containing protein n=1 Tax=Cirrhinus molitorella TaxID=172907 RepID=A0ABR3LHG2_9TELE
MLLEEVIPPLPDTPCNSPAGKLRRTDKVDAASISTQLSKLSQLVKNRSDGLEKLIGENKIKDMKEEIGRNTEQISGMTETIEFICSEVKGLKERVNVIDSQTKKVEIVSTEQEKRLAHLEAYTRRWNLRIHGIPEKERENVHQEVIDVCQRLLPQFKDKFPDVVDVAHRLGRPNPQNKGRGIIFQFTSRFYRDAVWRAAKDAEFLFVNRLKKTEDLSPADKARRIKLWPAVEKARKENKQAFFVGGHAFVDGTEIFPQA